VADEQVLIEITGSDAGAKAVLQQLQKEIEKTGASGAKAGNAIAVGLQAGIDKILQMSRTIDVTSKQDVAALRANAAAVRELATIAGLAPAEIQKLAVAEQVLDTRLKATNVSLRQQAQVLAQSSTTLGKVPPQARTAANAFSTVAFAASGMTGGLKGGILAAGSLATSLGMLSSSARIAASATGIGAVLVVLGTLISLLRDAGDATVDMSRDLDFIRTTTGVAELKAISVQADKNLADAQARLELLKAQQKELADQLPGAAGAIAAKVQFKKQREEVEAEIRGLTEVSTTAYRTYVDTLGKLGEAAGEKAVADAKQRAEELAREEKRRRDQVIEDERELSQLQQKLVEESVQTRLRAVGDIEGAELTAALDRRRRLRQDVQESTASAETKASTLIEIENAYQAELEQIRVNSAQRRQRAAIEEFSAQRNAILADLDARRGEVEREAAQGLISQRDAEREIARIERERIPVLTELAAQMLAFATATKDPELLAAAQNLSAQIGELGVEESLNRAAVAAVNFKDSAIDAVGGELSQFLGSTINDVESVEDAFRSLALGAVQAIQRIIAELIALRAMQALTGALGGGGKGGAPAIGNFAGTAPNFARPGFAFGGLVRGPGTSTSDSIPAMLSHGEFVMSAAAVKRIGPNLLAALNAGAQSLSLRDFSHHRVPHFAAGGLVDAGAQGAGGSFEGRISLAPGLVYEELRRSEGARVIVEIISDHRKSVRALLEGR
jgi:hypothetical protein